MRNGMIVVSGANHCSHAHYQQHCTMIMTRKEVIGPTHTPTHIQHEAYTCTIDPIVCFLSLCHAQWQGTGNGDSELVLTHRARFSFCNVFFFPTETAQFFRTEIFTSTIENLLPKTVLPALTSLLVAVCKVAVIL